MGILALLIAFGSFVIALLAFLDMNVVAHVPPFVLLIMITA